MGWSGVTGEPRRVYGGIELLRAAIDATWQETMARNPANTVTGIPVVPTPDLWNAAGGPTALDNDDLIVATAIGSDMGLYRAYRVQELSLVAIGGDFIPVGTLTCGLLVFGAIVSNVYHAVLSNSTAGAPAFLTAFPPTDVDVSSGGTDPCGIALLAQAYSIPDICVLTVQLPPLSGDVAQEHAPEYAIAYGAWYPGGMNEEIVASAFSNGGVPQWARWCTPHGGVLGNTSASLVPRRQRER